MIDLIFKTHWTFEYNCPPENFLHLQLEYISKLFKLRGSKKYVNVSALNQSRICGKRVCLGLFPSDSLESQSYEVIEIAHIGPYYGVENDCRNFRSNRMDSFCKNQKKSKMAVFWPFLG